MSTPLISIITVNFNQIEVTCALLDSIRRQDYRTIEIIVVDNGSRENPAVCLSQRYPEAIFVRSDKNLGFAGGNNLGLRAATGDYLFFINNDAELTTGCLARLLALLETTPDSGIVSPLLAYYPTAGQTSDIIQYAGMTPVHPVTARNRMLGNREPDRSQFDCARPTAYAHGAAMLLSRVILERVGPMSEDFFLYYEELDWCERIRRAGYSVWIEPRARVYHKESLTVQALGALKTYYLYRNRIYFMRRNRRGWQLGLFYAYLWLVLVPKNLIAMSSRREWFDLRAFWQSVRWNFGARENNWEKQNALPVHQVGLAAVSY